MQLAENNLDGKNNVSVRVCTMEIERSKRGLGCELELSGVQKRTGTG